jgi:hypothetical protein
MIDASVAVALDDVVGIRHRSSPNSAEHENFTPRP